MLARLLEALTQSLNDAGPNSDILWICHTDDALAETAKLLARKPGWSGKIIFHSSGALSSDVLSPLKRKGASTASLHPMMTFVPGATPRMEEVPFAVEGDSRAVAVARRIVRDLGAESFAIKKAAKPLYHALGSFSSPLIVAALVTAERVGRGAGLTASQTRRVMTPISAPDDEELCRTRSSSSLQRADQARRHQYRASPLERTQARARSERGLSGAGEISFDRFTLGKEERANTTYSLALFLVALTKKLNRNGRNGRKGNWNLENPPLRPSRLLR